MQTNEYHEINHYNDLSFPVELYRGNQFGTIPFGRGLRDFHWHDEMQFTLALNTDVTIQVEGKFYSLKPGQALFINSGRIHAVTKLSSKGEYVSLNFSPKLLTFFPGSRMEKNFVLPYSIGGSPAVLLLDPQDSSCCQALDILHHLNQIWLNKSIADHQYFIAVQIVTLWNILLPLLSEQKESTASSNLIYQKRLQQMISFIYENFSEEIALQSIADSAHISIGECCRIFRTHLQTTPHHFLTEYRIRKSVELLSGTQSISEIAGYCGYNQVSNYISKFKRIIGCTPFQYRKQFKSNLSPEIANN